MVKLSIFQNCTLTLWVGCPWLVIEDAIRYGNHVDSLISPSTQCYQAISSTIIISDCNGNWESQWQASQNQNTQKSTIGETV